MSERTSSEDRIGEGTDLFIGKGNLFHLSISQSLGVNELASPKREESSFNPALSDESCLIGETYRLCEIRFEIEEVFAFLDRF